MFNIIVKNVAGKVIQELPLLPNHEDLFIMKNKVVKKSPAGRTIQRLASAVFNRFVSKCNHIFDIKELAEDLQEDKQKVYDVCNVFEALGLVVKMKVNKYCWLGWDSEYSGLRQLKTLAVYEDLKSKFLESLDMIPVGDQDPKLTMVILTEKVMKLFLLLNRRESLSKDELLHFVYGNEKDETDSCKSGPVRISRVFKILVSLGLIQEKDGTKDTTKLWRNDTLTRYVYVGPSINVAGETCDDVYTVKMSIA